MPRIAGGDRRCPVRTRHLLKLVGSTGGSA